MYAQGQGPDQAGAQPGAEQAQQDAPSGAAEPETEEGKVEDADYEVVDDDEKKK